MGTAMTDLFRAAAKRSASTIDRAMSQVVLLFWVSTLEREIGAFEDVHGVAD